MRGERVSTRGPGSSLAVTRADSGAGDIVIEQQFSQWRFASESLLELREIDALSRLFECSSARDGVLRLLRNRCEHFRERFQIRVIVKNWPMTRHDRRPLERDNLVERRRPLGNM